MKIISVLFYFFVFLHEFVTFVTRLGDDRISKDEEEKKNENINDLPCDVNVY